MHPNEIALSSYGHASSIPSPVNRMTAVFADDYRSDIDINLGVGYVNEDTMPRKGIHDALADILANPQKYPAALNYGGARGAQNLVDAIRTFTIQRGTITPEILAQRELIVGSNGASSILEGLAHVIAPGLVVMADPIYYIYGSVLERLGYTILAIPEDENGLQTDILHDKLRSIDKTDLRFIFAITINNPSGTILSTQRRKELVSIASELSQALGRKVPVFFDAAYELLIHDPTIKPPQSGLCFDTEGLAYEIGTLSKILAPALRIGYLIGPSGPLIDALLQKTTDAGFSAPLITQEIAGYLLTHHLQYQLESVNREYRNKAQVIRECIDKILGEALENISGGQAGFYYYLTFKDTETHEQSPFFKYLARTTGDPQADGPPDNRHPRVIYVPGEFCVHTKGDLVQISRHQLRISYGYESLNRIQQAITLMADAVDYAQNIR